MSDKQQDTEAQEIRGKAMGRGDNEEKRTPQTHKSEVKNVTNEFVD